jgi:hypothetical protein
MDYDAMTIVYVAGLAMFTMRNEYLNIIAILAVMAYMIFLFIHDKVHEGDPTLKSALLIAKHPSTAFAFWFFFSAFGCLLVLYLLALLEAKLVPRPCDETDFSSIVHGTFHVVDIVVSNLASAMILAAGFAYSRGAGFKHRNAFIWIFVFSLIILIWALAFEFLGHWKNLLWTTIEGAPGVVIANIATVSLGWALFARWSGPTWVYLLATIVYAILQFPANIAVEFACLLDTSSLRTVFPLLAAGKIILAYGFLLLLCSSASDDVKIDEEKHWPDRKVALRHWMLPEASGWIGWIIHGLIFAFIGHALFVWLSSLLFG